MFVWSEGALEFADAADTLRPFTRYEYRLRARNSRGSADSRWSSVQTLEAPPQGLPAPWAHATGAHSVWLNWTEPASPHGITSQYRVVYQEQSRDPALTVPTVLAFTVTVSAQRWFLFSTQRAVFLHFGVNCKVVFHRWPEATSSWGYDTGPSVRVCETHSPFVVPQANEGLGLPDFQIR